MQILVASGGGNLIYFEIGRGLLMETKRTKLDYEIACLDINPKGENCIGSNLVAVGVWTDVSIQVYALPSLTLVAKESLGGEIIPRSVLFCSFEGVTNFQAASSSLVCNFFTIITSKILPTTIVLHCKD